MFPEDTQYFEIETMKIWKFGLIHTVNTFECFVVGISKVAMGTSSSVQSMYLTASMCIFSKSPAMFFQKRCVFRFLLTFV